MNLHDEIMNIQARRDCLLLCEDSYSYLLGHRDARHAAAELALGHSPYFFTDGPGWQAAHDAAERSDNPEPGHE